MNGWIKGLLVVGLAVSATMAVGTSAAAQDGAGDQRAQYADAMWYFVPQLGRYAAELDATLAAVEVKPELAARLQSLAYRGEGMVYDLEGTPVPAEMNDAHERLMAALRQMNEAAQIGAEDPQGARYLMETYEPMLDGARREIRGWLMVGLRMTSGPDVPALSAGHP